MRIAEIRRTSRWNWYYVSSRLFPAIHNKREEGKWASRNESRTYSRVYGNVTNGKEFCLAAIYAANAIDVNFFSSVLKKISIKWKMLSMDPHKLLLLYTLCIVGKDSLDQTKI